MKKWNVSTFAAFTEIKNDDDDVRFYKPMLRRECFNGALLELFQIEVILATNLGNALS